MTVFQDLMSEWEDRAPKADRAGRYLDAVQTPRNTSILAPPELRMLYFTKLTWCKLGTGALEERISISDVSSSVTSVAKWLRKIWRDIDGAQISSRTHWEALGQGRAYVAVTSNADGSPRATMLTAKSTVHLLDPDTGELKYALHVHGALGDKAELYEKGRTTSYLSLPGTGWVRSDVYDHGYPRVPIVVFSARSSCPDGYGEPIAKDIWSLQDAAIRVATDGAIAGALMAVPQRVIMGATQEEQKMTAEKLYLSRLLTLSKADAKIEQFSAAQLQQFSTLLTTYARQAASLMALPVSMFGVASEANPASGDSQRQDDTRINRRSERLSRDYTSSWQLVLQLLLDFSPTAVSEEASRSATVEWVDPANPTRSELADMALKLASASYGPSKGPLVSRRFILRKLGLTDAEIDAEMDELESSALEDLLKEVEGETNPGPTPVVEQQSIPPNPPPPAA